MDDRENYVNGGQYQNSMSPPVEWSHNPPLQMPWGVSQPSLVRFTGEMPMQNTYMPRPIMHSESPYVPFGCTSQVPCSFTTTTSHSNPRTSLNSSYSQFSSPVSSPSSGGLKRKNDSVEEDMMCAVKKLHISDDKRAPNLLTQHEFDKTVLNGKSLVISEELQKFHAETENDIILPSILLDKINRPCTAVVLWKPRKSICSIPSSSDEEDTDNNNSSHLDLNNIPSFSMNGESSAMSIADAASEDTIMEDL